MYSRSKHHRKSLVTRTTELGFAAPVVVAHRVARMALAGTSPTARDRKEFHRMGAEKAIAFAESWNAMTIHAFRANCEAVASFWRSYWMFWLTGRISPSMRSQLHNAAHGVLNSGLGPVHRRAVANAKRLARSRLG